MKTIFSRAAAALLFLAVILYSCQRDFPGRTDDSGHHDDDSGHSLDKAFDISVFLTDHQTPAVDSILIDIQKLEIKFEDDSIANDGWVSLTIHPGIYNILRLRNGIDTLFGTGSLPNGHIKKVRMTLGNNNSVMVDGQTFDLKIHDNMNQVVADLDDTNFEISSVGQLLFWIDFDAAKSIRIDNSGHGNNNGYELEPHINIFTRHKSGSVEGRVLPRAADALVMAINGADTTMAIPEDNEGEFKILGLKAGTYQLLIDGNNGYSDTTINNVIVTKGEDTHVGIITLHQ